MSGVSAAVLERGVAIATQTLAAPTALLEAERDRDVAAVRTAAATASR